MLGTKMLDFEIERTPKEKIIKFVNQLKKIGPDKTYRTERYFHFGYVPYLLSIEKELQQKNYENVVDLLRYILIEEGDYIRQLRFYGNLIHILEKVEKD